MTRAIQRETIQQVDTAIDCARKSVDWKQASALVTLPKRGSALDDIRDSGASAGYAVRIVVRGRQFTYHITEDFSGLYTGSSSLGWRRVVLEQLSDETLQLIRASLQELCD